MLSSRLPKVPRHRQPYWISEDLMDFKNSVSALHTAIATFNVDYKLMQQMSAIH